MYSFCRVSSTLSKFRHREPTPNIRSLYARSFFFSERGWIGTYCSVEICHAVSLGYSVLQIFEGYVYQKQAKNFSPFMKTLAVLKQKVSRSYECSNVLMRIFHIFSTP